MRSRASCSTTNSSRVGMGIGPAAATARTGGRQDYTAPRLLGIPFASMATTPVPSGWHQIRPKKQHKIPPVYNMTHAVLPLHVPPTLDCSEGRPIWWQWGAIVRLGQITAPGCNLLGSSKRRAQAMHAITAAVIASTCYRWLRLQTSQAWMPATAAWPTYPHQQAPDQLQARPQAAWGPSMPPGSM